MTHTLNAVAIKKTDISSICFQHWIVIKCSCDKARGSKLKPRKYFDFEMFVSEVGFVGMVNVT